jgi:ABC-type sugar transport system ATPase subunit
MIEPFLRTIGISKSFPGVQALKNVSIEAFPGEVLSIVGINGAGKTTFMNVLGGIVQPDEGEIYIEGKLAEISNPLDAEKYGIAFVHQEMGLFPTMSIVDNMYISSFPNRIGIIDYKTAEERCESTLKRLGCDFHPRTKIQDLSPGDQQMVEIARALLGERRLIIFDEPTSSLSSREKTRLFEVITSLKKEGVIIIFITHLLHEIFEVGDRLIAFRNGEVVGGGMIKNITYKDVISLMIGEKETGSFFGRRTLKVVGDPVLEVESLSRRGVLDNINFTLHKGEVLGIWGLLGSGRTELARALVSLDPIDKGRIKINHNGIVKTIRHRDTKKWFGIITENRRKDGLLLPVSVKTNISLAGLRKLISRVWPLIDAKLEIGLSKKLVDRLDIKITSLEQQVATLSGGNQQKVILARWLLSNPPIYIMDEPTRGLSVEAKSEVDRIIGELAESGAAILNISSDIDELMNVSGRYLVMRRGRIVAEFQAEASKSDLMAAAAGGSHEEVC